MSVTANLVDLIAFVFTTHDEKAKIPSKRFRKWDGQTPYGIHPTWCALTLLSEHLLPHELRQRGAQALLLHDILEDTTSELPDGISPEVRALVDEMTYAGGTQQEMREVWSHSKECRLLKLYDKLSNVMDSHWMEPTKLAAYKEYTLRLAQDVETNYGLLNAVQMAKAVCENP
jgi:(p)ppGpp synthase/HD superfamily hydrolase